MHNKGELSNQRSGALKKISKKAQKKVEREAFNNFVGNMASPSEQIPNLETQKCCGGHRLESMETWKLGIKLGVAAVVPEHEVVSRIDKVFDRVTGSLAEGKESNGVVS